MNTSKRDFLTLSQEEIMQLYAAVHLKQSQVGVAEFATSIKRYLERNNRPLDAWRRELKLERFPVKARVENWSFDSSRIDQNFEQCLSRTLKYGNGGTTTRIIGYDLGCRRVLTETGSIYELVAE